MASGELTITLAGLEEVRKLMEQHVALRAALVALIGADGREDLEGMRRAVACLPAADDDAAAMIAGIDALLLTLPA